MTNNMKKLNITKEQFNRSLYFKNKYGELEYVSESGKVFRTDKGKVLMFNESIKDIAPGIQDWGTTVYIEKLGAEMSWDDLFFIVKKDCRQYPLLEEELGLEPHEEPTDDQIREWIKTKPDSFIEYLEEFGTYNDNFADDDSDDSYDESTKKFGRKFVNEGTKMHDALFDFINALAEYCDGYQVKQAIQEVSDPDMRKKFDDMWQEALTDRII